MMPTTEKRFSQTSTQITEVLIPLWESSKTRKDLTALADASDHEDSCPLPEREATNHCIDEVPSAESNHVNR
jgi:hypothetical protein